MAEDKSDVLAGWRYIGFEIGVVARARSCVTLRTARKICWFISETESGPRCLGLGGIFYRDWRYQFKQASACRRQVSFAIDKTLVIKGDRKRCDRKVVSREAVLV